MNLLAKKRKGIAVVLDEYGGTSGIITLKILWKSFLEKLKMNTI
jgi:Mg2+/Co2+ transporter CorC